MVRDFQGFVKRKCVQLLLVKYEIFSIRMAIESISQLKYTRETDYWSYGVTLWEMFTVVDKEYPKHSVLPYEAEGIKTKDVCQILLICELQITG